MANLTEYSKSQLASALQRSKSIIAKARNETKLITKRTVNVGLTAGSGYLVGLARNKLGDGGKLKIPGTEVDADLVAGVVMSVAGLAGFGDDYNEQLCSIGAGTLAGYLAIEGMNNGLPGPNR
jgi:delta 1-pyrroline-5-carboxylate dehydrogenase